MLSAEPVQDDCLFEVRIDEFLCHLFSCELPSFDAHTKTVDGNRQKNQFSRACARV